MTGINLKQLKYVLIEPALNFIGLGGAAAVNLVTGTALVESGTQYLKQIGTGPALGLWQMEPATEQDCWTNFLVYQSTLSKLLNEMLWSHATTDKRTQQLIGNLPYAAAMCRIKYRRSPLPFPANTAEDLAHYHKIVYNSSLGAANPTANMPLFQQAIDT